MKVGIAGVGGIGSNVAINLLRAGCTSLKLVDFDKVEHSNLNRQFYFASQIGGYKVAMLKDNLLRIDSRANIEVERLRLDAVNMKATFRGCDILVEGFDEQVSKKLLVETFTDLGLPVVSASGIAGTRLENIATKQLGSCTVVGDFQTDFRDEQLYAPKISIISAMMADIVLKKGKYYESK